MIWGKDDWLRTLDGSGLPELETPAPALPAAPFAEPRRTVQPERTPRTPPPVWPRNHRECFPAVIDCAPPTGPLLQRDHRDGVRDRALSAGRGARLLLQFFEVPLSTRIPRRGARTPPACHVVHTGPVTVGF